MIRFGKPSADYIKTKRIFYDAAENERWLAFEQRVAERYREQPRRAHCVVCAGALTGERIRLRRIDYSFCGSCGHFNGAHEDTADFTQFLYATGASEAGIVYGDTSLPDYLGRVRSIYRPKVRFMLDALSERGAATEKLAFVDLGSGGGHFVKAMREEGLADSIGFEASSELVAQTNRLLGEEILRVNALDDLGAIAQTAEADVITMIFSLEHVRELRRFLAALRANRRAKWFFFAVPMFNPSVLVEGLFPDLMPRSLGLGHTHLFTDGSLDALCRAFGLKRTAEWWFGGNGFDLHRMLRMRIAADPAFSAAGDIFDAMMLPTVDGLQRAFDEQKLSSEIHLLCEFVPR